MNQDLLLEIFRFLTPSQIREIIIEFGIKEPSFITYLFHVKYSNSHNTLPYSLTTHSKNGPTWLEDLTLVHYHENESFQSCYCDDTENVHVLNTTQNVKIPMMSKIKSQERTNCRILGLNLEGELQLFVNDSLYNFLHQTEELQNWIIHCSKVQKPTIIYPQIPLIPEKVENFYPINGGNYLMTFQFRHPKKGMKFINFTNKENYFMAIDSNLNLWINAYEHPLSPMVCVNYDVDTRMFKFPESINNNDDFNYDIKENPLLCQLHINDQYDHCYILPNQGFVFFKNGLRIKSSIDYKPVLSHVSMRPCLVPFKEFEYEPVNFAIGNHFIVVLDKGNNLSIVNIVLDYSDHLKSLIYRYHPDRITMLLNEPVKDIRVKNDRVLVWFKKKISVFDSSLGLDFSFDLDFESPVWNVKLARNNRILIFLENGTLVRYSGSNKIQSLTHKIEHLSSHSEHRGTCFSWNDHDFAGKTMVRNIIDMDENLIVLSGSS
ncbi:Hypothetical protein PP7435_CHR2-0200 [Komagataella phaffii CBS 7435]|uniref:Uncharacterized protein n=2 Tax=Komagataella phaffii TaxID=460519 RepID=C4R2K5_KOMPG|nr:Hypothetical protein PAS_chr2-2_0191 [Komagataella phaffii GS115]AOA62438.1 GQ67_01147T0 [Komagataella phaffii]CAH2447716.1 Hypothetical protein BQ9382_C2-1105 [Komagataella phaffii CBS 7435]AOA67070.1 GQ68_00242T0 [Komagataella phaffii GS115]CAY69729.1 Hypothetical protein PAS_chr2-2_0191 [Komagataella phaffii GS115]CCA37897.1 Hypothetical protein PP7435_CHR2-0200 [Komagataella phaffii CBS 7435]